VSGHGKDLPPTSAYAGDDGSADPRLRAALGALALGGSVQDVVAALAGARVLVPVLAEVEAVGRSAGGLHVDREASTGVVALRAPDGRTALPVFSDAAQLAAWGRSARPVPAEGPRAAASALQEGWDLLVLDPAGAAVVIPRPAVRALATGMVWHPALHDGRVREAVVRAVTAALGVGPAGLRSVAVEPGRTAEVAVVLAVRPGLARGALDALLAEVGRRLASSDDVTDAVDSLELRVVAAPG
jgi:hypothetical protein